MRVEARPMLIVAALLAASPIAAADSKKPRLELRVVPKMASSSTIFLITGDLQGGDDSEAFYCPTLEWSWRGEQDGSVQEEECPPFEPGVTKIERHFSFRRTFPEGNQTATLTLRKDGRLIAVASSRSA